MVRLRTAPRSAKSDGSESTNATKDFQGSGFALRASRSCEKPGDSESSVKPIGSESFVTLDGSESVDDVKNFPNCPGSQSCAKREARSRTVLKVPMTQKTFNCLASHFAELCEVGHLESVDDAKNCPIFRNGQVSESSAKPGHSKRSLYHWHFPGHPNSQNISNRPASHSFVKLDGSENVDDARNFSNCPSL